MKDQLYFIWYSLRCGVGSVDGVSLLELYDYNVRAIFDADKDELLSIKTLPRSFLERLLNKSTREAENVVEFCFMNGIRPIFCTDDAYPERLKHLFNRPIVLYTRGSIERLSSRLCVGVVGTRDMSDYGKRTTFDIVRGLCARDAVIVSGAAYGIDSVANNTAVYFESDTIAVLGSGVNVPYPRENARLLDQIAERGLVVSEFVPGTPPNGRNFPIRNRIISGLSDALLVVEADIKSGALITAEHALEQDRAVYAVPGNLDSKNSRGTNALIAEGKAKLCLGSRAILEDFADRFELTVQKRLTENEEFIRYEMRSKARLESSTKRSKPKPKAEAEEKAEPKPDTKADESAKSPQRRSASPTSEPKTPTAPAHGTKPKVSPAPIDEPKSTEPAAKAPSSSSRIWAMLDDTQKRVLEAFPGTDAVSSDKLVCDGLTTSQVLAALTLLELLGAVEALPGGMFKKVI